MTQTTLNTSSYDFEPAKKDGPSKSITRPSLSYWQDAWIRLKKNNQAIVSLALVLILTSFSLFGPFIWRVSPANQDLKRISDPPSFSKKLKISADLNPFVEKIDASFQAKAPDPNVLGTVHSLKLSEPPTIQGIRIEWNSVPGATGYSVYRSESEPDIASGNIGSPISEIDAGNKVNYEDTFNIQPVKYWYTVIPKNEQGAGKAATTISVVVPNEIPLRDALELDPTKKSGEMITLDSHPAGTDYLGRDVLSRLMHGGIVSLGIGLFAPLLSTLIGMLYGGISGFMGGRVDHWLMRFADFVLALPFLLFVILIKITFGAGAGESGISAMVFALVILSWTTTARLTRGQVLQLRETEFVQAAKLLGGKPFYLLIRHMLPNTLGIILVSLTFEIPRAIFTEAFLSFIGMGVVPPTPSWGTMCNDGIKVVLVHPHEFFFPALIISITVLAFNLLGDGLRDALDPRMRSVE